MAKSYSLLCLDPGATTCMGKGQKLNDNISKPALNDVATWVKGLSFENFCDHMTRPCPNSCIVIVI